MEFKIMLSGAVFFGGWLWFYLFGRQFCFNLFTVFPTIKKMQKASPELIANTSKGYTVISLLVTTLILAVIAGLIFAFCPWYYTLAFCLGAALAIIMYANKLTSATKSNFENFCLSYYRFVPDDVLRTAMYNKAIPQMKLRLHEMKLPLDFIPAKFKN